MSRPPSEPQKSPEPTAPPEPTESPDPAVLAPSPTATPTTAAIRPGAGLTALLRRLHFYAGILVAPFLIVAAVSGGLYALAPSIEQWAYRDLLHTESTGAHLPLTRQVTEAVEARPDLELSAVRPADGDGATTRVLFTDPALGPSERHAVFIDPVTGAVLGESVSYGSGAALPFRTWVSELHRHLHLGEAGRLYSELAASWLAVVALGGLILWISHYRRTRGNPRRRARFLSIDRSLKGRRRLMNHHGAMGVWIIVGLLFLSATGLTWSKYAGENIGELRTALNWTTPSVEAEVGTHADHSAHHGTATPAAEATSTAHAVEGLDAVMDTAAALGIDQAVEISIPTEHDVAYVVTESRAAWQFSPNSVAVGHLDGTGSGARILDVSWFADWPLAAKLTNWGIAAHMGLLFGLVNQFLLALLAGILVAIIVRGYQMWWQRRPRGRSGSRPGRAPSRGMLRRLIATPTGLAIAGTGLAVIPLIGWFVPLLGLPLLAFLAVDIILGMFARHRADTPAVDTSPSREEQTARLTSAEP